MFVRRHHHRRLAVWMTCCALVLAAIAPSVSRAQAFVMGQLAPWAVVCTAMGEPMPAEPGDTGHLASPADHCGYCQLRGDGMPPPPAAEQAPLCTVARHALPSLYWQAPRTLFAWRAAQPRGPPSLA